MKYYRICSDPDSLDDGEWATCYAVLEDIRNKEKEAMLEAGRLTM